MTSYNGYPIWSGTYLPFGYEWNPQTTVNTYKFTGMERDSQPGETGLDHTWFRQYNSAMGRWMTPDPAGMAAADPTNPQSWNRYAYVGNNPLGAVDPMGLADNDCIQDASCTFWTCNDRMSFCQYRCDPNIDPIDCEDPAGDANSYFNSIIDQNTVEAENQYIDSVNLLLNTPPPGDWVPAGGDYQGSGCLRQSGGDQVWCPAAPVLGFAGGSPYPNDPRSVFSKWMTKNAKPDAPDDILQFRPTGPPKIINPIPEDPDSWWKLRYTIAQVLRVIHNLPRNTSILFSINPCLTYAGSSLPQCSQFYGGGNP